MKPKKQNDILSAKSKQQALQNWNFHIPSSTKLANHTHIQPRGWRNTRLTRRNKRWRWLDMFFDDYWQGIVRQSIWKPVKEFRVPKLSNCRQLNQTRPEQNAGTHPYEPNLQSGPWQSCTRKLITPQFYHTVIVIALRLNRLHFSASSNLISASLKCSAFTSNWPELAKTQFDSWNDDLKHTTTFAKSKNNHLGLPKDDLTLCKALQKSKACIAHRQISEPKKIRSERKSVAEKEAYPTQNNR